MSTMEDRDGFIWMDGEWLDWRNAKVHVLTHTLHYGMGAFEGVRAYETSDGPVIFRLEEHTDRWFNSAEILGMNIPFDKEILNQAQRDVISKNNLKSAYIRPMCFYGSEGMGLRADNLKVHVMIAAWEWGAYLGEDNMKNGIRIRTSSFARHHGHPSLSKAKTNGNYVNSMMALQEALDEGYDEALRHVHKLVESAPEKYFLCDQYSNDNNWLSHYHGTAEEIINQIRYIHFVEIF